MGMRIVAALVGAAALFGAGQAAASVLTLSLSGTVTGGTDFDNFFGLGPSLAGQNWAAVFTIDDTTPGAVTTFGVTASSVSGAGASNPLTATFTINGVTDTFGNFDGSFGVNSDPDNLAARARDSTREAGEGVVIEHFGSLGPLGGFTTVELSPDYRLLPGTLSFISAAGSAFRGDIFHDTLTDQIVGVDNTYQLQLALTSATASFGAIPEPATWAFMVIGLGGAGAMLRRRRRITAALAG